MLGNAIGGLSVGEPHEIMYEISAFSSFKIVFSLDILFVSLSIINL